MSVYVYANVQTFIEDSRTVGKNENDGKNTELSFWFINKITIFRFIEYAPIARNSPIKTLLEIV